MGLMYITAHMYESKYISTAIRMFSVSDNMNRPLSGDLLFDDWVSHPQPEMSLHYEL